MQTFQVKSGRESELIDITERVARAIAASGIAAGAAHVYTPHTTAAITINENADPAVVHDLLADLERLVPRRQPYYRHAEGNSASHLKSSLVGCAQTLLIEAGRPVLGTWQGIYFCEFDGPRARTVHVQVTAAS